MTWEDFGGPNSLDYEARRLAYLIDGAVDPRMAAAVFSQDLYGLPTNAAIELIRRTQAYEDPNQGAQVIIAPVLAQGWNGLMDTGQREVRLVGPGIDEEVAILQGSPQPFQGNGFGFDPFAAITGFMMGEVFRGLERDRWRDYEDQNRYYAWNRQNNWGGYNQGYNGWDPYYDQGPIYDNYNPRLNHRLFDHMRREQMQQRMYQQQQRMYQPPQQRMYQPPQQRMYQPPQQIYPQQQQRQYQPTPEVPRNLYFPPRAGQHQQWQQQPQPQWQQREVHPMRIMPPNGGWPQYQQQPRRDVQSAPPSPRQFVPPQIAHPQAPPPVQRQFAPPQIAHPQAHPPVQRQFAPPQIAHPQAHPQAAPHATRPEVRPAPAPPRPAPPAAPPRVGNPHVEQHRPVPNNQQQQKH